MSFADKYGPWALITGASAGLGEEFARQLAALGLNLVLVARRKDRLQELAVELSTKHPIVVKIISVDLSRTKFMRIVEKATKGMEIGLLVNNAGFGVHGPFLTHDLNRELEMLDLNCRAPLILTHHFAADMVLRRRGGIIFLGSTIAYQPAPYMAHYAATKVHNQFFGEALWYELKGHNVDVITVNPGTTATEFQQVSDMGLMSMSLGPYPVVKKAIKNLGKRHSVIPGFFNRISAFFSRVSPRRWVVSITGNLMRGLSNNKDD